MKLFWVAFASIAVVSNGHDIAEVLHRPVFGVYSWLRLIFLALSIAWFFDAFKSWWRE